MLHLLKLLLVVDGLMALALLVVRSALPPHRRTLVSGKLAAIALVTPAVALLSGDLRLLFLYLAAVVAVGVRSRRELVATALVLLPSLVLAAKGSPGHLSRIVLCTLVILGIGTMASVLATHRGTRPSRGMRAASWIGVALVATLAAGSGQGFLSRVATGASMLQQAVSSGQVPVPARRASGLTSVGTNLYWNDYPSLEFPFINRMKTAGAWATNGADPSKLTFTVDGYPTNWPQGTTMLYTMVALDPVKRGGHNTYVLTWTGHAVFFIAGQEILSKKPGRIVFNFTRTDSNQTFVAVGELDPAHPLGNMAIVRSDQVDLYNKGEIFNPAFIDKVGKLDTLRFMDWNNVNTRTTRDWADRTLVTDYSWSSNAKSGVPIEVEVALANKARTNMWLDVPTEATDDYVRRLVGYVHGHLDPSLSLHLEYSNEVWNWAFKQSHYAAVQADKLWGNGQHFGPGWVTWYGYRAAQIASIANQVYGSDASRLHNVLATQTAYKGLETYIVDGVSRAHLGRIDQLFDDYAVATYFGGMLTGRNDADRATIVGWAKSGDAGVAAAIQALKDNRGLTTTDNGSLAWLRNILTYQAGVAQRLGLNLVAYEGGIDLTVGLSGFGTDEGLVTAFLNKLKADPRMGDIYTQMTSDFGATGGKLLNIYTDVGAGYGTNTSTYDANSPAWNALVVAEAAARAANAGATTKAPLRATAR